MGPLLFCARAQVLLRLGAMAGLWVSGWSWWGFGASRPPWWIGSAGAMARRCCGERRPPVAPRCGGGAWARLLVAGRVPVSTAAGRVVVGRFGLCPARRGAVRGDDGGRVPGRRPVGEGQPPAVVSPGGEVSRQEHRPARRGGAQRPQGERAGGSWRAEAC